MLERGDELCSRRWQLVPLGLPGLGQLAAEAASSLLCLGPWRGAPRSQGAFTITHPPQPRHVSLELQVGSLPCPRLGTRRFPGLSARAGTACHREQLCPGMGAEGPHTPRGPQRWVAGPGAHRAGSPSPRWRLTLMSLLPSAEMETNNHFNFTGLSSAPAASGPKPTPASGDSPFTHGSPLSFPPQGKSKCPQGASAAQPGVARTEGLRPAAAPCTWGWGQGSVACPPSPWPRKVAVPEQGLCVDLAGQLIQRSPAKRLG